MMLRNFVQGCTRSLSGHSSKRLLSDARGRVSGLFRMNDASNKVAPSIVPKRAMSSVEAAVEESQTAVGVWLLGTTAMVFGAVVLGGVTRLTESGLSMVNWHPIKGMKPPSTQEEWEAEFEDYKKYPEYKYSNGMTVDDFKQIFYMEYGHRMWGRLIGVAFILPAVYFWSRGRIHPRHKKMVLAMGGMLGFQGVLGWLMVKSGLDNDPNGMHAPRVSQYRLAAHLGSAFILYVMTLWVGLSHILKERTFIQEIAPLSKIKSFKAFVHGVAGLIFITAMSGAFVAGLDAGLIYNEFPLMGESIIPSDLWQQSPKWKNIFENPTTAQFNHRVLGVSTFAAVSAVWLKSRSLPLHRQAKTAATALLLVATAQVSTFLSSSPRMFQTLPHPHPLPYFFFKVSLGIATLLYFVPTPLAATHQAGSLTLLTVAVWLMHELKKYKILKK
eukprot:m.85646 g.85646  ORF g.85646 m.85646 type:complete len:442 (+) comp8749_c2_seq4:136-1461(+)